MRKKAAHVEEVRDRREKAASSCKTSESLVKQTTADALSGFVIMWLLCRSGPTLLTSTERLVVQLEGGVNGPGSKSSGAADRLKRKLPADFFHPSKG